MTKDILNYLLAFLSALLAYRASGQSARSAFLSALQQVTTAWRNSSAAGVPLPTASEFVSQVQVVSGRRSISPSDREAILEAHEGLRRRVTTPGHAPPPAQPRRLPTGDKP